MSAASDLTARLRLASTDALRHGRASRGVLGRLRWGRAARALAGRPGDPEAALRLLEAARLRYPLAPGGAEERALTALRDALRTDAFPWDRLYPDTATPTVTRGIVLKAPGAGGEKGVLLVSFESQWLRLLRHADVARLAADYELVLAPTWSPPYDLPMLLASRLWPGPFFTTVSNLADMGTYARWLPNATPVPVMPSSFVHPDIGAGARPAVTHDLVMIANFAPYKRHFALFRALGRMSPRPRVRLVGVAWGGRDRAQLLREAALYGVADAIEIHENASDAAMPGLIRSARAAVILTRTEGACIAAAEALMMDVPLGMLADAHVGSLAFVNERTGLRLDGRALARDLRRLIERAPGLAPRRWMLEQGIDCFGSTRVLEDAVREATQRAGRPWTRGLWAHTHVRLAPSFVDAEAAAEAADAHAGFAARYGVTLTLNARGSAGG